MAVAREAEFRDLYEILGVPRGADEETLQNAYRVRARQLHPDVSKDPNAEERFRELSHAYDVLSKPRSRLLYDRLAYRGPEGGGFGAVHEGVGPPAKDSADLSEDELIGWIFTDDAPDSTIPVPREDRLLRVMAAVALGIAIVLIAIVLFR
jgi:curved DNA-binding protein CbpA